MMGTPAQHRRRLIVNTLSFKRIQLRAESRPPVSRYSPFRILELPRGCKEYEYGFRVAILSYSGNVWAYYTARMFAEREIDELNFQAAKEVLSTN